jgi:glycosyltransferase involved in cell wall biosynthesis
MKVSIITPSFNQEKFIERTIKSILNQKYYNLESIIIDGCSNDNTVDILKKYDESITWLSEKDNGQSHAINKGLLRSSGDIVAWLNSDDIYYENTINLVVNYFKMHPDIDVVYGCAHHIDVNDNPFENYPTKPWNLTSLKSNCFICQPSTFLRRSVIDKYGLLNENLNYCMDYEYWLRLGNKGVKFGYITEFLSGSRLYLENKTLGSKIKVHTEINEMLQSKYGIVPERWLFNYVHAVLDKKDKETNFIYKLKFLMILTFGYFRWNTDGNYLNLVRRLYK